MCVERSRPPPGFAYFVGPSTFLQGATPVAWRSQFHGISGLRPLEPGVLLKVRGTLDYLGH